ncbi:MAG TPA: translation initiation factor IF-2 [Candidatus Polarisedimenticolia bacterium]|nr:translation initiation factor IF-2 [Candidatus Polarisedimenticolia bacterium]
MAKIRVYQLAKLLKISNDEAVDLLRKGGVDVKSNLSSIDEELVERFRGKTARTEEASSAVPASKTAPKPVAPAKAEARPAARRPAPPKAKPPEPIAKKTVTGTPPRPAGQAPASPGAKASGPSSPARPVATTRPAAARGQGSGPGAATSTPAPRPRVVPPEAPRVVAQTPSIQPPSPPAPTIRPVPAPPAPPKDVVLTEGVTIKELSEKTEIKSKDIIKKLLDRGILATINQPLDIEIAKQVCRDFGYEARIISFEDDAIREHQTTAVAGGTKSRDPVVTIMGHVDHGKTSLLDAIRESKITEQEHGGITQHIGAYHVQVKGRGITFIDTPGHEAFTLMRSRGARVTDVVVLVVAADDGVMPQTIEAIDHARAAGVPIVVAINKIDKPGANLDRVKKALADQNLLVEDWGGQVVSVAISAKQRLHIDDLLDMILLVADLNELKADPEQPATGTILEARLDRNRGSVATVLVQNGTLRVGDAFIAGAVSGKVRAMLDDRARKKIAAGPSIPVEVLGLQGVPLAGDRFQVIEDEVKARQIGTFRQSKLRQESLAKSSRLSLEHLFQQIKEGAIKELPIVLKADVQGSVEVLAKSLDDLSTEQVKVRLIHTGTGAITETDVLLASASNAIIVGFNVRPDRSAADLADKEKVDIRLHTVIYEVHDEIKSAMVGLLEPKVTEQYLGRAEIRNTFKIPKIGTVAGTYVVDGKMLRGSQVRLLRNNVIVHQGRMASLKRFKEDVGEVKSGYECGIGLERFNDVKVGDIIEAFKLEKVYQKTL